jgi:hypothetical protein
MTSKVMHLTDIPLRSNAACELRSYMVVTPRAKLGDWPRPFSGDTGGFVPKLLEGNSRPETAWDKKIRTVHRQFHHGIDRKYYQVKRGPNGLMSSKKPVLQVGQLVKK